MTTCTERGLIGANIWIKFWHDHPTGPYTVHMHIHEYIRTLFQASRTGAGSGGVPLSIGPPATGNQNQTPVCSADLAPGAATPSAARGRTDCATIWRHHPPAQLAIVGPSVVHAAEEPAQLGLCQHC